MGCARGRPFAAALPALAFAAAAAAGDVLTVEAEGRPLLRLPVEDGAEWCLEWQHSVTGGDVADCFVDDGGTMVLQRSYLHDFAAGLGTVAGRGTLRSAEGGGYWIEDMDEPIAGNALRLRVGREPVDHRLTMGGRTYGLTEIAAGERVVLRLASSP